jgi:hypothetical protein
MNANATVNGALSALAAFAEASARQAVWKKICGRASASDEKCYW